jgi:hypothetical protein
MVAGTALSGKQEELPASGAAGENCAGVVRLWQESGWNPNDVRVF